MSNITSTAHNLAEYGAELLQLAERQNLARARHLASVIHDRAKQLAETAQHDGAQQLAERLANTAAWFETSPAPAKTAEHLAEFVTNAKTTAQLAQQLAELTAQQGYSMSTSPAAYLAKQAELLADTAEILTHHHGAPAPAVTKLQKHVHDLAETLATVPSLAHLAEAVHELAGLAERDAMKLHVLAEQLKTTAERCKMFARTSQKTA